MNAPARIAGGAVRLRNLTLGYDRHPAVHHLEAEIAGGSLTAVVGPNGSGKSTLLRGIVGELRPMTGAVSVEGAVRGRLAYLPQQAMIDRSFPITVAELAATGLWHRTGAFGGLGRQGRAALATALEKVGMSGTERRPIAMLSGGQMQRVLFARVILQDAPLILLDEPFSAIDERAVEDLMGLVRRWHGEGRTVIAVLHDLDLVRAHFPWTLLMGRELVGHGPTPAVLNPENFARARALCAKFDEDARVCAREAG